MLAQYRMDSRSASACPALNEADASESLDDVEARKLQFKDEIPQTAISLGRKGKAAVVQSINEIAAYS